MSDPIVFISRNRIKAGRLAEFRKHYQASIPPIQAGKPGTLAQLAYENEDATQVTVVRFFPDADALDQQLRGADERSKKTYEFIEPLAIEIYGMPNPATLEKMLKIAGSGISVRVHPRHLGGFIR
jgi:uncharacterized protein YkuJ